MMRDRRRASSRFPGRRRSRSSPTKFSEAKARGGKFGVIGSNHTTNEENFFLQKFARQGLGHQEYRSPSHRRSGDVLRRAFRQDRTRWPRRTICTRRKPCWWSGADLAQQHPFLAFQARANFRHHSAHIYAVTAGPGSRRQSGRRQRSRPEGRGSRRRRIAARQAEGRRRSGHRLRRLRSRATRCASWSRSAIRWAFR